MFTFWAIFLGCPCGKIIGSGSDSSGTEGPMGVPDDGTLILGGMSLGHSGHVKYGRSLTYDFSFRAIVVVLVSSG